MNIVIITTKTERYHRYFAAGIAKHNNVVAVIHPTGTVAKRKRLRRLVRNVRSYGLAHCLLRKLTDQRFFNVGWKETKALQAAEQSFFPDANKEYECYVSHIAHEIEDINSAAGVRLLRTFEPDVVVCSGGPVYRTALIEVSPLMLNYHTGLSPLYNGAYTNYWTYANGQPHLTGGTLMKMSRAIDGGDILAHYLPSIEVGDDPTTLFMKCIIGGVKAYNRFLAGRKLGQPFTAVPQGRALHNFRSFEWTIYQTLAIERYIDRGICKNHGRDAKLFEYWKCTDSQLARKRLRESLIDLTFGD